MMNHSLFFTEQLSQRPKRSLSSRMSYHQDHLSLARSGHLSDSHPYYYFLSSYDDGVIRNGGRYGSKYAPQVLLNQLEKMSNPCSEDDDGPQLHILQFREQGPKKDYLSHEMFHLFQQQQIKEMQQYWQTIFTTRQSLVDGLVHLGGGHDHIYSLVKSLLNTHQKPITIFNIDAHADTRVDRWPHSGTPFRQIMNEEQSIPLTIHQIGLHSYANDISTLAPVPNPHRMIIHTWNNRNYSLWGSLLPSLMKDPQTIYIFSLDCDALQSSVMESVSAVNALGFTADNCFHLLEQYLFQVRLMPQYNFPIVGCYEYNPLYDNLSVKGAKYLAGLLHRLTFSHKTNRPLSLENFS